MVFVVKLDVARVFLSDRNVWHFESPSIPIDQPFCADAAPLGELGLVDESTRRAPTCVLTSIAAINKLVDSGVRCVDAALCSHLIKLRIGN